jgi:iron complex transport system permease protein
MSEADSEVTTAEDAQEGAEQAPSNGVLLAAVGIVWMAAMLWSARATITGRTDVEMEVTSTAYAMPGAISASLVAGAAVALTVIGFLTRGGRAPGVTVRFIIATGTGLGVGLLGALSIITINTEGWLYAVVGGTVAAAATIGGALAGFRYPRVTAAVCWGAVTVFAVGFVLNYLQSPLLPVFGPGDTSESQAAAASRFALAQSVLSGLAGALAAYRVLRHARRRTGDADVRWPLYALAGAGPGLLLIVGEGLARTAGARVLELAGKVSELELTVQQMLSGSRLNNGLIVLFVGAFTAMIAVGRTLGPAPEPAAPDASALDAPASDDPASDDPALDAPALETPAVGPDDPDEIERAARADEPQTVASRQDD